MADAEKIKNQILCGDSKAPCENCWQKNTCPYLAASNFIESQQSEIERIQQKWIPVSERLPEDGSDILAYYDNKIETRIIACNYYKGEWSDCVFNTETVFKYITHWMPLPKPPREG